MTKISNTMEIALRAVPVEWTRCREFRLPWRPWVRPKFPLFQPTFMALRKRGLIEFRGGPGTWEWRLTAPSHAGETRSEETGK